jgi:hypothetical protein
MISRALFEVTIRRFLHWSDAIALSSMLVLVGASAGAIAGSSYSISNEVAQAIIFGPFMPFLLGFPVAGAQIANSAQMKHGEFMALLFTRPISKWEYVFTKWLCGSFFLLIALSVMVTAGVIAQFIVMSAFGAKSAAPLVDGFAVCDGIFNILSVMSLVVLVSSMPRRIFLLLYFATFYGSFIIMTGLGVAALTSSFMFPTQSKLLEAVMEVVTSLGSIRIDTYHLSNSSDSPVLAGLVLVSNIALRLTLANVILSLREYFYAND